MLISLLSDFHFLFTLTTREMSPRSLSSNSLITIVLISIIIPASVSDDNPQFTTCTSTFNCGRVRGIGYPFWGSDRPYECGRKGFQLVCRKDQYPILITNLLAKQRYRLLDINRSIPTMKIARDDIWDSICPSVSVKPLVNLNLYAPTTRTLHIFYGCTAEVIEDVQVKSNVTCLVNGQNGVFYAHELVSVVNGCHMSITAPVLTTAFNDLWDGKLTLHQAVNLGFDVEYSAAVTACSSCEASGGACGSGPGYEFACYCSDKPHPGVCPKHGTQHFLKPIIGSSVAGIGVLVIFSIICYIRCAKLSYKSMKFPMMKAKDQEDLEALIKHYGSLGPKRYSYSDVKKMTNSLKDKIGQGGYGGVYKGNLPDGRPVAVKILNISKGNGEEFINEVASISRTSHVNVVSLLGFCLEDSKRALIYEFMPNGSLEKFIYGSSPSKPGEILSWEKLHQISMGIARGLEYLHRGCNTQILHFDIKPHNILLNEDFCPKISDFGLAKLCTTKQSIVSMLGARGTIGYIAPEVFSRNFGRVSHKSDVYSYGMMVLEMVGGRKNSDVGVSHTSEIYFPHWIYKRLEPDENLGLRHATTNEENDTAKKMIIVGLWCIQTDPLQRPSMKKVLDMLEGSIDILEIPPKPFICSPARPACNSSTTEQSFG